MKTTVLKSICLYQGHPVLAPVPFPIPWPQYPLPQFSQKSYNKRGRTKIEISFRKRGGNTEIKICKKAERKTAF